MICGACSNPAAGDSTFAETPGEERGGFTTAPGSHRVVEAAAVIPSSVSSRVADVASGARSDPPPPIVGAASNFELPDIPEFLRRTA